MNYNSSAFVCEFKVPKNELIISKTDLKGNITYANSSFANISGYTIEELIGKPHNILRHPDVPKVIFKDLWEKIESIGRWEGIVKNLRKDHRYYWVLASISQIIENDKVIGYQSIRVPVAHCQIFETQILYDKLKKENKEKQRIVQYF
jgi:aerotaxis receptor